MQRQSVNVPPDYRVQDACQRCRHVYVRQQYDEPVEYYCTAMLEISLPRPGDDEWAGDLAKYQALRSGSRWIEYLVLATGICSRYEEGPS